MSMTTDGFESWLLDSGYREATVRKTVSAVATVLEYHDRTGKLPKGISHPTMLALGKLVYFGIARPNGYQNLIGALRGLGVKPCAPAPMPRRAALERVSITDADWQKLAAELGRRAKGKGFRHREYIVLWFMVHTGLRIGETLGIEIASIDRAQQTGLLYLERKGGHRKAIPVAGATEPLALLVTAFDRRYQKICQWICDDASATALAPDASYQRCRRAFQGLGRQLGIDGRIHLHRIRRTVAVQALRLRRDTKAVQQLLGQQSIKSTEQYVDELRQLDVATLQQDLQSFREKP